MRTITHIGSTTDYNYTITTSDAYSFVFEPNTMTVEVGAGYNDPAEVTLSVGITNPLVLSRYCIDNKAVFDLSVFAELYFSGSDFTLDYVTAQNDPFYKSEFNILVKVNGMESENVPFSFRWGAYQFDEALRPAVYFPFWENMPLVVNSEREYDSYVLSGGVTISGSGVKTIPVSSSANFDYQVLLAGNNVKTNHYVLQTCPTDGHYLQWVDSLGKIWHYMFYKSRDKQTSTEIKTTEEIPYYPLGRTDSQNGLSKIISKTKQRSFGCYQSVDENNYKIVESILSSPIVKYYDQVNFIWIGVKIKDATINPMRSGMVDIEFTVELPKDFIQRR